MLYGQVYSVDNCAQCEHASVLYVDKHALYGQVYSVDNCSQCEHASVLYVDKCALCGQACALWTSVLCGQLFSM